VRGGPTLALVELAQALLQRGELRVDAVVGPVERLPTRDQGLAVAEVAVSASCKVPGAAVGSGAATDQMRVTVLRPNTILK